MAVRFSHADSGGAVSGSNALARRRTMVEPPQARKMAHLVIGTVRFLGDKWRYDVLTMPMDVAERMKRAMERHARAEAELSKAIGKEYPELRDFREMESEKYERYKKLQRELLSDTRREKDFIWRNHGGEIAHHYFAARPDEYSKFEIIPVGEVKVATVPELVDYS